MKAINRGAEFVCLNQQMPSQGRDGEQIQGRGGTMLQRSGPRKRQLEEGPGHAKDQRLGQDEDQRLDRAAEGEWGEMAGSVEELKSLVELLSEETAGWSRRVILEEVVCRLADLELQLGVRPTGTRQAS